METTAKLGTFKNILKLYDSTSGDLDLDQTASFLEISVAELAKIFGVSKDQIRPDRAGEKTKQRIEELAGALEAAAETLGDIEKTKFWLKTPNPHFGYISPRTLILKGRHEKVRKFITSVLYAD